MFLLTPAYKQYLWGGTTLSERFGKDASLPLIAESWELSVHPDGPSRIASGPDCGRTLRDYLLEHPTCAGGAPEDPLPVLIKLIDAQKPLSVQVHPDDAYAYRNAGERGKTELWHILEAKSGAFLYLGLNREIARAELSRRIADGTVEEVLRRIPVQAGESYYVPAGMLHAIGAGIVLYEIQESSNQTYRVYDYGRLDAAGKPRPLHIESALAVARLSPSDTTPPGQSDWQAAQGAEARTIVRCPHFTLREIALSGRTEVSASAGDFLHLLCVSGRAQAAQGAERLLLSRGEGLFLPAGEGVALEGNARLIAASRGAER